MKRKILKSCISAALVFSLSVSTSFATEDITIDIGPRVYYEEKTSEVIAEGLTYEMITKFTENGFVDIHVLKMELENPYIEIDVLRSDEGFGEKETLTNMTEDEEGAIAGINGSFFNIVENPSDVVGPEFDEDYLTVQHEYNKYGQGAASLIQSEDGIVFDYFTSEIILVNSEKVALDVFGINKLFDNGRPIIFNQVAIQNSNELSGLNQMYKIAVEDDVVIDIKYPGEEIDVPEDGFIVVFTDDYLDSTKEHNEVIDDSQTNTDETETNEDNNDSKETESGNTSKYLSKYTSKYTTYPDDDSENLDDNEDNSDDSEEDDSTEELTDENSDEVEIVVTDILDNFSIGEEVVMKVITNFDDEALNLILSGGAKILDNGDVFDSDYITSKNSRQPRTATGITEDGKYLIAMVVDGRGDSIGATHDELAAYLLEYGVRDAIHYDGGGSSEMVAREIGQDAIIIKNTPSDGSERRIVNGLGFESNAPTGDIGYLYVNVDNNRVFVNEPIEIGLLAQDEFYNPYEVDYSDVFYEVQGIKGYFEGNTYIPTEAGSGTITCNYRGYIDTVFVTVVDTYIDLELADSILELDYLEQVRFEIYGTDKDGYKSKVDTSNVEYTMSNPSIGSFEDGVFTASDISGMSKVSLVAKGREISGYIVVGNGYETVTSFEEVEVETLVYPENVLANVEVVEIDNVEEELGYDIRDLLVELKDVYNTEDLDEEEVAEVNNQMVKMEYIFDSADSTQAVYAMFEKDAIKIEEPKGLLYLTAIGDNQDVMFRARVVDDDGESHNITFANHVDFEGVKRLEAELPKGIAYPIYVDRIYVARLSSDEDLVGRIYFDLLETTQNYDTEELRFDYEEMIDDPLLAENVSDSDFHVSIFGATSDRNRLIDEVVLQKVYETMNEADLAIYAGSSAINLGYSETETEIWDDTYHVTDTDDMKIIYLATSNDSLVNTDPEQWEALVDEINDSLQSNIILIGDANPVNEGDFSNEREGELLHSILKQYQEKSGKNIFYINANGYDYNVNYFEGIRYIDINGLWYTVSDDRKVYLNDTFKVLDFYIVDGELKYEINNLYPKVEF